MDLSLTRARYLLALSLYIQRKNADEAVHHLSLIAGEYPRAQRLAAALLWQAGKYDEARAARGEGHGDTASPAPEADAFRPPINGE